MSSVVSIDPFPACSADDLIDFFLFAYTWTATEEPRTDLPIERSFTVNLTRYAYAKRYGTLKGAA